jgi:hypothetical protein
MSKILNLAVAIGILIGFSLEARATEFPLPKLTVTQSTNLLTTSTNATGAAVNVENNTYHTFHIISTTNGAGVLLDRSLDASNWVTFSTNVPAVSNNPFTTEVTMTGKWSYVRARTVWTNGTYTINYLGGK